MTSVAKEEVKPSRVRNPEPKLTIGDIGLLLFAAGFMLFCHIFVQGPVAYADDIHVLRG